jgi:prepilin signal peptidase PulO-like enzyme (type II secretory pathway)
VPEEEQDVSDEPAAPETPAAARANLAAESGALTVLLPSEAARQWQRIAIVVLTGAVFAAAGTRYDDPSHLALVTAYIAVLVLCSATDVLAYRVPNVVTYPAMLLALGAGALMPDADFVRVLGGGALAGGIMLLPTVLTRGKGLGMGDVKLAAFVGLALGISFALSALLLMALAGGAVAAALMLSGLRHRGDPIPYAPFISLGALAVILWQGVAFHSFP